MALPSPTIVPDDPDPVRDLVIIFLMLRIVPGNIADILFDAAGMIDPAEKTQTMSELAWTSRSRCNTRMDRRAAARRSRLFLRLGTAGMRWCRASRSPPVAGPGLVLRRLFGVPLGVISAVRQNTGIDYLLRVFSLSALSMPSFWLGLLVLMFFVNFFGPMPIYNKAPQTCWAWRY